MNIMFKFVLSTVFIFLLSSSAMGASMAAGESFSLVLKLDGTVWAWGRNTDGPLGDGTTEDRRSPVQVIGLTDVISVSAGRYHSLAVKRDGTVWAWGWNGYGQLGNGTTTSYDTPNPTPGQVIGLSDMIDISGGSIHSLFLRSDGTVWACGSNRKAQLGDGTTTDRSTPVQVTELSGVIAIAAGGEHSLALKRDGTVWAWGWNHVGQLGDGNGGGEIPSSETNYSTIPVQAIGLSNVIAITAGYFHSLAIKNDGTLWVWGANVGQFGNGNDTNSLTPVKSLLSGVIAIEGTAFYTLALTSYGTVWFGGHITLWNSGYISSAIPIPVDGLSGIKAIAADDSHALALKNDGTLWAWGNNGAGELGDGTTIDRKNPVQVQGFFLAASSAPASVMATDFDADSRADPTAVDSSGNWYFWHSSQTYSREGPIALGMTGAYAAGDVDGDGRGDIALVDSSPSTGSGQAGIWHFWLSSRDYAYSGSEAFGPAVPDGTPVLADFDGDGKADPTIVDSSGTWTVWLSGRGYSSASGPFAVAGATPVAADFNGDGKADPVMVAANGDWYVWSSTDFYTKRGPFNFGVVGKPVAGDFDGDRRADPAMMDSSGNWYFMFSTAFYLPDGPWYLVLP